MKRIVECGPMNLDGRASPRSLTSFVFFIAANTLGASSTQSIGFRSLCHLVGRAPEGARPDGAAREELAAQLAGEEADTSDHERYSNNGSGNAGCGKGADIEEGDAYED